MQNIRQSIAAVLALASLVVLTGCDDRVASQNGTMETTELHKQKWSYEERVAIENNATNPKTIYVKDNQVQTEVQKVQPVAAVHIREEDSRLQKLIQERDGAINLSLELEKRNKNLALQKSDLAQKIERLIGEQKQQVSLRKEKSVATEKLAMDKNTEIAKLIKERDEAINVTLKMQKEQKTLQSRLATLEEESTQKMQRAGEERTRELDKLHNDLRHMKDNVKREVEAKQSAIDKLQHTIEIQKKEKSEWEEKLSLSATSLANVKKLVVEREREIDRLMDEKKAFENSLIELKKGYDESDTKNTTQIIKLKEEITVLKKKRDEAIRLADENHRQVDRLSGDIVHLKDDLQRTIEEKERATAELKGYIASQKKGESTFKEKLALSASALLAAKSLAADKEGEAKRLAEENARTQKMFLTLKSSNEESTAKSRTKIEGLHKELETLEQKIAAAKKRSAMLEGEIGTLTKERDDAIKVTLKMKKANETLQSEKSALNRQITKLTQTKNVLQKEIESSKTLQLQSANLAKEKSGEISKIIQERDEAIKVTLKMKKANEALLLEKTALVKQIESLKGEQSQQLATWKSKLEASKTAQLDVDKTLKSRMAEIKTLTADREKVDTLMLEMKNKNETLAKELQTLKKAQTESASASKEKLTTTEAALQKSQNLVTSHEGEIAKLVAHRDKLKLQITELTKKSEMLETKTVALDKELKDLTQAQTQNASLSKEKMATAAAALLAAQQLGADRETEVNRLKEEIKTLNTKNQTALESLQIKITEWEAQVNQEMSARSNLESKLTEAKNENMRCAKKLVIGEIVDSFKLSKVEFKTGSAILTEESKLLLDNVAEIMQTHQGYAYRVQG
ncbi:MAG: hypothetical protein K0U47_00665, partial [Epsilonproteobacteria bacterium]|nr:hypothetical protein [Campylobacterota bacterium]